MMYSQNKTTLKAKERERKKNIPNVPMEKHSHFWIKLVWMEYFFPQTQKPYRKKTIALTFICYRHFSQLHWVILCAKICTIRNVDRVCEYNETFSSQTWKMDFEIYWKACNVTATTIIVCKNVSSKAQTSRMKRIWMQSQNYLAASSEMATSTRLYGALALFSAPSFFVAPTAMH